MNTWGKVKSTNNKTSKSEVLTQAMIWIEWLRMLPCLDFQKEGLIIVFDFWYERVGMGNWASFLHGPTILIFLFSFLKNVLSIIFVVFPVGLEICQFYDWNFLYDVNKKKSSCLFSKAFGLGLGFVSLNEMRKMMNINWLRLWFWAGFERLAGSSTIAILW